MIPLFPDNGGPGLGMGPGQDFANRGTRQSMAEITVPRARVSRKRALWGSPWRKTAFGPADGPGLPQPGPAAWWERAGLVLMLVLLIIGLPMAYQRAIDNGLDLAGFCDAGRLSEKPCVGGVLS